MVFIRYNGNNLITSTDNQETILPKIKNFLVYPDKIEFLFSNERDFNKINNDNIRISYTHIQNGIPVECSTYKYLIVLDHTSG